MDKSGDQRTLWLVGMMGVGKSTVGPVLAEKLGLEFLDSDHEIERREGQSIPQIFEERGEPGFRLAEFSAIEELAGKHAVVALGGGAIAETDMSKFLSSTGTVIYLKATPATLLERIGKNSDRPLLAGLDAKCRGEVLEQLLRERSSAYETASVNIGTDGLNPEQVTQRIEEHLGRKS